MLPIKSQLYKKSLEVKFEGEEKLFTIRDLTLDVEFDIDLYFKEFNKHLMPYEKRFLDKKAKLKKLNLPYEENFNPFEHIQEIIDEKFTKKELIELARWGREHIVEFEEEEIGYFAIVSNLYSIFLNFTFFRYSLKKK